MQRMKELRQEKNLSQKKLAEALGISQQLVNNYENGHHQPDIAMLKKMSTFFATSIDYLVGFSPNRDNGLSAIEKQHLTHYRHLSPRLQTEIDCLCQTILQESHSLIVK